MHRRQVTAVVAGTLAVAALQLGTAGPSLAGNDRPASSPRLAAKTGKLTPTLTALARSSRLRHETSRNQARALSLPARGAGSLMRRDGRLLVEVRVTRTSRAQLGAIRRAGGRIVHVSARYATVTAAVGYGSLRPIARLKGVQFVQEVRAPMIAGASAPGAAPPPETSATCPQGNATSEGDAQLRADLERAQLGGTGAGITVGVISDSYDRSTTAPTHAAQDIASGDLPGTGNPCGETTPVNVLDDSDPSGEDEGRAMLQVVHDLAPDAKLAFATAFTSETAFADNIRALAAAGANVIVDDVSYFDEPFYQDGPVADAVNDVTAQGVVYYSSAANNNLINGLGQNVASWEAPAYRPTTCSALFTSALLDCMDFNPGVGLDNTYGISVGPHASLRMELQWAEPWHGVTDDIDAYLVDTSSNTVVDSTGTLNNLVSQEPFEQMNYSNPGSTTKSIDLVVGRFAGTGTPRLKVLFLQNSASTAVLPTEYTVSSGGDVVGPTIFGHNGAANAITVAAVPYSDSTTPERYSSRGPVTLLFGPVLGTTPAAPLATPQVIAKPDLAATDCAVTTFFATLSPPFRFCGTSEAAPHAAAVAALEKSLNPGVSRAALLSSQTSTARAVGAFGPADVGAGLIDALGATDAVTSRLTVARSGNGNVTSADGHLSCGSVCSHGYAPGAGVVLTAAPGAGLFVHWTGCDAVSGNQCSLTMGTDRSVNATFAADTTAPVARMVKPSKKLQLGRSVKLSWAATDAASGVKDYTVQMSTTRYNRPPGSFRSIKSLTNTTRTSARLRKKYGATYCFRVRARDNAGNVSRFSGKKCVTLPVDDPKATASPGWTRKTGQPTPSHTLSVATKHGRTLTLSNVRARRVGVVVRTCKGCGTATLLFNGNQVATVHLGSRHAKTKVVLAKAFRKTKSGTLVVRVASHGKLVQVDGFVASLTKKVGSQPRSLAPRVQE
jgi:hypothetical protein